MKNFLKMFFVLTMLLTFFHTSKLHAVAISDIDASVGWTFYNNGQLVSFLDDDAGSESSVYGWTNVGGEHNNNSFYAGIGNTDATTGSSDLTGSDSAQAKTTATNNLQTDVHSESYDDWRWNEAYSQQWATFPVYDSGTLTLKIDYSLLSSMIKTYSDEYVYGYSDIFVSLKVYGQTGYINGYNNTYVLLNGNETKSITGSYILETIVPSNACIKFGITNYSYVDAVGTESNHPQVPEPGSMFLLGSLATGLFGFAGFRKRFTK